MSFLGHPRHGSLALDRTEDDDDKNDDDDDDDDDDDEDDNDDATLRSDSGPIGIQLRSGRDPTGTLP